MITRNKRLLGHAVRWLLIVFSVFVISKLMFASSGFQLEKVIQKSLNRYEVPVAPILIRTEAENGNTLLLMVERKHNIYYQLNFKRSFGFLWSERGGTFGIPLESEVMLNFLRGSSTEGKYRQYKYFGQVNDPEISKLQVVSGDGNVQEATIKDGFYQAVRTKRISTKEDTEQSRSDKLLAYDANGKLLYELDEYKREIRTDTDLSPEA